MNSEDAILMDAGDGARVDETAFDGGASEDAEAAPQLVRIEHDGREYVVPVELGGAFLRHADYTRKTQELADQRRELEAHRQTLESRAAESHQQTMDRARLAALDENLGAFEGVDWELYAQQDPEAAQAVPSQPPGERRGGIPL